MYVKQALRSRATLHDQSYCGILELYGLPQLILEVLQLVSVCLLLHLCNTGKHIELRLTVGPLCSGK